MSLSLPIAALLLAALVIADFFIPMLPSATVIAALAGFLAGDPVLIAALTAWAAAASWLGDRIGYHVFRRTRARMRTPILNSANITRLEIKLRASLGHRPRTTAVIARFVPAGRTALAWAAVTDPGYPHARTSAIAAGAWAAVTVGLGLLIGAVFGAGLLSVATAATTVAALSVALTWWFKTVRSSRERAADGPSGRVRRRA